MIEKEPEELEALRSGINLGLLAKHIVEGFLLGMHSGTRRGTGTEFSQYRSYQPGDDIRQIDWNMYARSDRYYIKESETESSITIRFFLDNSASMAYEENGISRFRYASLLTAVLATIAFQQGDAIALSLVNNLQQDHINESRDKSQLSRIIHTLDNRECKGHWPESSRWLDEMHTGRSQELWVVCSDLLDGEKRWESFAERGTASGNEIQFLQVLGKNELSLDFEKPLTVKDPGTENKRSIRPEAVKKEYLENLNRYLNHLDRAVLSSRSRLHRIQMSQPIRDAIFHFLSMRQKQ